MGQLDGKVAIVTGGGRSIGRAFCKGLAAEGATIVIADIADSEDAAREIAGNHAVEAMTHRTDVSDEASVIALVAAVMDRFGRIDILVNNAAWFATMPVAAYDEISVEMWDRVMAVNARGPFLMVKHVAPHMVAAGYGKIVNIGSGTALKGVPNMLAYVSSKGAILGFTRALSRELGPHGICVNTLSPGLTESDSLRAHTHHMAPNARVVASRAMPRTQVQEDLVGGLVFLAGPASDFMTGQTLAIDGGSTNT
jgi:NAD(P)-dependent dehydrogenase (short-subunit alcohol dehydrogenase family)